MVQQGATTKVDFARRGSTSLGAGLPTPTKRLTETVSWLARLRALPQRRPDGRTNAPSSRSRQHRRPRNDGREMNGRAPRGRQRVLVRSALAVDGGIRRALSFQGRSVP